MAQGEALGCEHTALLLLWLGACLCLCGWPQIGNCQHHSPPEVVIPVRVSGRGRVMKSPGWVSYSLHFGGQRHVIHMKPKKFLVSSSLSLFTYTDQGALVEDHPFVRDDCYYYGYVEGDPESQVAINNCLGGFQGTFQTNDTNYEIKPISFSTTFEHLVYKMVDEESELPSMQCGLTDEEIERQLKYLETDNSTLMQSDYKGWWLHQRSVVKVILLDHEAYLHSERNVTVLQNQMLIISHMANTYLIPVGIDMILAAVEIWTTADPFELTNNVAVSVKKFATWKKTSLYPRMPHDVAYLIAKKSFSGIFGLSYTSTLCHATYSCGIIRYTPTDLAKSATYVVHQLGHLLGLKHDDSYCICGDRSCLMSRRPPIIAKFSNCSYGYYIQMIPKWRCVYRLEYTGPIFSISRCGNAVIEQEEECDCGSLLKCREDPCCMENCTLVPGAACAFGLCCQDCQFAPAGEVCRESSSECDLPEWCNGTSHQCPEDVYVQAGVLCTGGGSCYEKRCNDREEQCRQIFGKVAKSANQACYSAMNMLGNRFGNCGLKDSKYITCTLQNTLCGRLQCENVMEIPLLKDHSTVHWTHYNGVECWGTDYHYGMTIPDVGEIRDGTACGPGRICMQKQCVRKTTLNLSDCVPEVCNMRGVCNNKQHCHCSHMWNPPFCQMEGHGGSVDSGPPPPRKQQSKQRAKSSLLPFLWIPLLVLLCCCLICLLLMWKKQKEEEKPKEEQKTDQVPPETKKEPAPM
ncbi:disintegrin and metalloproteinase domain-containing protein 21 [Tupaia chinensis]|uniref:Disintegrin and metalloproteinase domain-containing protein 20 n=1 Tax=Tupaia chinensis TaxID=246437 RepID=L9KR70_TUPCH|nr:disintegrin and metalloproteinase domain-containing protein 21 [Tupaia chinensis]XP_014443741.1 disintegrin and metalloproteinase domain-containing protein 21 [Tupaia chinensis]XP_014443742.1 disintegrin and metalloproteinase domain-containing protein 21 [Tupaia chinensis]XP_014443743.1 disintegrin and metalloproteinase domain-containing protein 21 [Tupaia chinensis]XP_014443744.1 disintegrin and metalloproteinase domain-containing protein 21 [Tupaia chinensis]XP_014443745.1 disintegrin and